MTKNILSIKTIIYLTILLGIGLNKTYCTDTTSSAQACVSWSWAKAENALFNKIDIAYGVAVDNEKSVYITGAFRTDTFIVGNDTLIKDGPSDFSDIFIIKYDSLGNVIWTIDAGGDKVDIGRDIAVDDNGNIYVVGEYSSASITFNDSTLNNSEGGSNRQDLFIIKLDPNGNVLWARDYGSTGGLNREQAYSLSIDNSNNVIITGEFSSSPLIIGTDTLTRLGGIASTAVFVAKFDQNGNPLWARSTSGSGNDRGRGVTTDQFDNVYITGFSQSGTIIFGLDTLIKTGTTYSFIAKYDQNGNEQWAKASNGTGTDESYDIAADNDNNVYITGKFSSTNIQFDSVVLSLSHGTDMFLVKFNSNGKATWGKAGSGTNTDIGNSVTVDNTNHIYVAGEFGSNITLGSITLNSSAGAYHDIFLAQYDQDGNVIWADQGNGSNNVADRAWSVTTSSFGDVYIAGEFESDTLLLGTEAITSLSPSSDIFVAKLSSLTPIIPTITVNGDTLTSSTALSYQWYISGVTFPGAIPGATQQQHIALKTGIYSVEVTDAQGCNATSDTIYIFIDTTTQPPIDTSDSSTVIKPLGINIKQISVFPNPANNNLTISLNIDQESTIVYKINNLNGQVLKESYQSAALGNIRQEFNLSGFPNGFYFLYILTDRGDYYSKRILINHNEHQ